MTTWIVFLAGSLMAAVMVSFFLWRHSALKRLQSGSVVAKTALGDVEYAQKGQGPVVVVLHGGVGGWDQGIELGDDLKLADCYTLLAPSRVGYLRTPLTTGETPDDAADAVAALLDVLGVEHAAVVGLSGGGPTALTLALRHPERVRALVMMAAISGHHTQPSQTTQEWMVRVLFSDAANLILDFMVWIIFVHVVRWAPKFMIKRMFRATETFDEARINQRVRDVMKHPAQWKWPRQLFRCAVPMSVRKVGLKNDLKQFACLPVYPVEKIACPTLVVHGRHDGNVPFSHAEFVAQKVPRAEIFVLESCGHLIWMSDEVDLSREAVTSFLKRHMCNDQ